MLKEDRCRLKRLAWVHTAYCRCPLGEPGCQCTEFQRTGLERLFGQLSEEMAGRGKVEMATTEEMAELDAIPGLRENVWDRYDRLKEDGLI